MSFGRQELGFCVVRENDLVDEYVRMTIVGP